MESLNLNQLYHLPLFQKLELIEYLLNHKELLPELIIDNGNSFTIASEITNKP